MKTIIIILLSIWFNTAIYGQQVTIQNTVIMSLPKNSGKLNKSMLNTKDSNSKVFSNINTDDFVYYYIDGYPVRLLAGVAKKEDNYLKELEINLRESAASAKHAYYNTAIKRYNNFQVLVIVGEYKTRNTGRILFFCVNNSNNKCFNGYLEYPVGERANAENVIESLLKSSNFK